MPITKLLALLQFRTGSHSLPVKQGRIVNFIYHAISVALLCSSGSVGDERHYLFECSKSDDIRAQYADLFQSSSHAMRSFVWHKDQQAFCDCMTAVIRLAET